MNIEQNYEEFIKSNLSGMIDNGSDANPNEPTCVPISNFSQPQQYPQNYNQQPVPGNAYPYPQPGNCPINTQPQYPQSVYQQSYAPTQQPPMENTITELPAQTVNALNQNNTEERLDFCILYEAREPAMYLCERNVSVTASNEIQTAEIQKITNHSGKSQKIKTKLIASGCAQFIGLIEESREMVNRLFCKIQVDSNVFLKFPVKDIFNQNASVKKELADRKICFVDLDSFRKWCLDIARRINYAIPIKKYIGFYKENGIWRCADVNTTNSNFSEQMKAVKPFLQSLDTYSNDVFEELTLVLYGLISKMFTVLKSEEIPEFAEIILANPDIPKLKSEFKKIYSVPEAGFFDDYIKSLKKLSSCESNSTPVIVLSDTTVQNNTALNFLLNPNNLNCCPLLLTKGFDKICKCENSQNFLMLKISGDLNSDISKIIEIFLCELLANSNFVQEIKSHMQNYSSKLSDSGLMTRVQNLYSLMLALIKTIFTQIGCADTDELCERYCQFLADGDSVKNIDVEKLRYILTSDIGFARLEKQNSGDLADNFLYFSEKTITLNARTMSLIAERFGFSKHTAFSAALKANDLLDISEKSNSKVVNLKGNSVRAYSFSIEKVFSFGDFIPDFQADRSSLYSIPIGSLGRDRTISFSVGENKNNTMYVSGQSGCGKTNFCSIIAAKAAEQNMSVVIIGKNNSISDLCPEAEKIIINSPQGLIRWNEINQSGKISKVTSYGNECDNLLSSFYEFRQNADEKIHTLLILDEVQDFSWDEKSPLREMLRQGRKFGISIVLSTQYLNAGVGKDIGSALNQCASFCFFSEADIPKHISKKYPIINDAVLGLDKYEAMLVGNFSVNGVPSRAPLRFKPHKS